MAVPKKRSVADLKATILDSAQTSHFEVEIIPTNGVGSVREWIRSMAKDFGKGNARIAETDYFNNQLKLSCHQTTLPGSSFATHDLNNKMHNLTSKVAYRKTYDQSASFSFYVDKNYDLIHFFENWMSFVMGENNQVNADYTRRSYRAAYPETYISNIAITKFERDYAGRAIVYEFLDAYPASINSMDISYQGSQILSCTVNFNYTLYKTRTLLL